MNCQLETYMVEGTDIHLNMNVLRLVSFLYNHFWFVLADGAANLLLTVLACLLIDVPVADVDGGQARGAFCCHNNTSEAQQLKDSRGGQTPA